MQELDAILTQYSYIGFSGLVYHPVYSNNKWSIGGMPCSCLTIARLCKIPEDEAIILRLKHGS